MNSIFESVDFLKFGKFVNLKNQKRMKQFNSDSLHLWLRSLVVSILQSSVLISKIPITHKFRSPALSEIFIMSLHTAPCLLCFFKFLCARVYLSSLCNAIRSSDRKGVQ